MSKSVGARWRGLPRAAARYIGLARAGAGWRGIARAGASRRENGTGVVITDHLIQWVHHDPGNICSLLDEMFLPLSLLLLQELPARNFPLFTGLCFKTCWTAVSVSNSLTPLTFLTSEKFTPPQKETCFKIVPPSKTTAPAPGTQ